jgi:DNA repair protein RadC
MSKVYNLPFGASDSTADFSENQEATIQEAIGILESRLRTSEAFTTPGAVKRYCQLNLAKEKDEYFCCLFLDNQHHLLSFERLFRGTIDGANVYPRVVARRALEMNAAAVIFAHNHPSGNTEPSQADIRITEKLKDALTLIDIRVLDHIVAGTVGSVSMAERGLL